MRFFGAHREVGTEILPSEGRLAPFEGATGWLNSEPLEVADVVLRAIKAVE